MDKQIQQNHQDNCDPKDDQLLTIDLQTAKVHQGRWNDLRKEFWIGAEDLLPAILKEQGNANRDDQESQTRILFDGTQSRFFNHNANNDSGGSTGGKIKERTPRHLA